MDTVNNNFFDYGVPADMDLIRSKRICLLGCGSVGCNVVLAALSTGWNKFTLVDFDTVAQHNCPGSGGLFDPKRDVGKNKALLLAEYIAGWDCVTAGTGREATAIDIDVRDLGAGFFEKFDFIICALDNMESVWHAGELTADTGVPIYRAATNAWNSSVEIIENRPGEACLCCGMDPSATRDLRRASCGERYMSDVTAGKAPSLQVSSALCANRLVAEMTRRADRPAAGCLNIRYYDDGRALMVFDLQLNPNCACHGDPVTIRELPGDVFSVTLADLLHMLDLHIGEGATVFGADDFVAEGICGFCGEKYRVGKPLRRVREGEMRCSRCPGLPLPYIDPDGAVTRSVFSKEDCRYELDMPLFDIGFRVCGEITVSGADGKCSVWRFADDYKALTDKRGKVFLNG
jgi:molybdopterin/thiamine biosynthesis adenylyltransferase